MTEMKDKQLRLQDDLYRSQMKNIMNYGLHYQYKKEKYGHVNGEDKYKKTSSPKHVIIVGAGAAGLVAAYELSQAGHVVTILEARNVVGGRIKTIRSTSRAELHAEAGAMRFPGNGVDDKPGCSHYVSDFYIKHFDLKTRPFSCYDENGTINLFNEKVKMKDYRDNAGFYCDKYFKGWDANIPKEVTDIKSIEDLLERTIAPVLNELGKNPSEDDWEKWMKKWDSISAIDFFRHNYLPSPSGPKLRPWPEEAITGLCILTYSPKQYMVVSMFEFLHEFLSGCYTEAYTIKDGMDMLPRSFVKENIHGWNKDVHLERNIQFRTEVKSIKLLDNQLGDKNVTVIGVNTQTGKRQIFNGDAVIVTVPLSILKLIKFEPFDMLPIPVRKAIGSVSYYPLSKIILQFKEKFWRKYGINGGKSITTENIGSLIYVDFEGSESDTKDGGLIICYTFNEDSLGFTGLNDNEAIKTALAEVADIHPEATHLFECGWVTNWHKEPYTHGGYISYRPKERTEYKNHLEAPYHPIYLAGEGISPCNGWIQGALFSGLRAASQFFNHNESNVDNLGSIKSKL